MAPTTSIPISNLLNPYDVDVISKQCYANIMYRNTKNNNQIPNSHLSWAVSSPRNSQKSLSDDIFSNENQSFNLNSPKQSLQMIDDASEIAVYKRRRAFTYKREVSGEFSISTLDFSKWYTARKPYFVSCFIR
jgi:hypothetical protein